MRSSVLSLTVSGAFGVIALRKASILSRLEEGLGQRLGRFSCLFYGNETRNWRKPEDHVERDENGHMNSRHQCELTLTGQPTCQRSVRVMGKDIGMRGSGNKGFVVTVTCLDHVHELSSNPLSFLVIDRA